MLSTGFKMLTAVLLGVTFKLAAILALTRPTKEKDLFGDPPYNLSNGYKLEEKMTKNGENNSKVVSTPSIPDYWAIMYFKITFNH
jgi:hypothetical protein